MGIILNKQIANKVNEVDLFCDRLMKTEVNCMPFPVTILQVYMPTNSHSNEEVEEMYEDIEKMLKQTKRTA